MTRQSPDGFSPDHRIAELKLVPRIEERSPPSLDDPNGADYQELLRRANTRGFKHENRAALADMTPPAEEVEVPDIHESAA